MDSRTKPQLQKAMPTDTPNKDKSSKDSSVCSTPKSSLSLEQFKTKLAEVITHREFTEKYEISDGQELGKGRFGAVHRGRALEGGKGAVAVKVIQLDQINTGTSARILAEASMLLRHRHRHLVSGRDVFLQGLQAADKPRVLLVMELMQVSLAEVVLIREAVQHRRAAVVAQGVLEALAYLHGRGLMHRDVKPGNVMLRMTGWAMTLSVEVKLGDFGLVAAVGSGEWRSGGTRRFMAPELILRSHCTEKADMWALGVLLVQLFNPVKRLVDLKAILPKHPVLRDYPIPRDTMAFMRPAQTDFVQLCLQWKSCDRPTASQLRRHAFVSSRINSSCLKKVLQLTLAYRTRR